ncbi:SubName: Full=Uncharacterized protein {ECO:0000313/EMBL:CCA74263.1} [Serendipita indica DSM 11827]|nr:SubName: Full=Uncharacterized protein {ECO:0000313/EMBL:CCA74263.1} [Serendipita indica DSM 11827]
MPSSNTLMQAIDDPRGIPVTQWIATLTAIGVVILVGQALRARRMLSEVKNLPGVKYFLSTQSMLTVFFPYIPYVNPGWVYIPFPVYKTYNSDVVTVTGLFPRPTVILCVADASVAKEIAMNRAAFPKPVELYGSIDVYGPNVVSLEGDEWKMHRKITAPSFNERNNRLVFDETTKITLELFALWGKNDNKPVTVTNMVNIMEKFTLMVIARAAFAIEFGWEEDKAERPKGRTHSFSGALRTILEHLLLRIALPDSILGLWKSGRETRSAFREFKARRSDYMLEVIEERRINPEGRQRADVLSNMLDAVAEEAERKELGAYSFGDAEMLRNMFIFLLAGHETTAHSLSFVLALLAVHQDVQEAAYQSLQKLVPIGESLSYSHITKWTYGLAIFYEALRLFPPVTSIPKYAAENTSITTYSNDGQNTPVVIPVPKGTVVNISMLGLHYNPKYWSDPYRFNPERFLGEYNKDAFFPFASGPRACMGRRFGEIEAVTFIAQLVHTYRFTAAEGPPNETQEQLERRLLEWKLGIPTLHPVKVPLTFTRRI